MEELIQPVDQSVTQTADVPVSTPKSNRSLIIIFAIISTLLVAGSVFAGMQIGKNQRAEKKQSTTERSPEPTLPSVTPEALTQLTNTPMTPVPLTIPTITKAENGWLTYTHQPFPDRPDWKIPWKGFTLYYPPAWKLTENKNSAAPSLNLEITKANGDYIEIIQAAGGGGYCLFPDQPEFATFDGMAIQFTKFIEIDKGNGIVWRLADWPTAGEMWSHQLCESFSSDMFENGFVDTTIVGFTKIKVSSPESLKELTEILKKIEITN